MFIYKILVDIPLPETGVLGEGDESAQDRGPDSTAETKHTLISH